MEKAGWSRVTLHAGLGHLTNTDGEVTIRNSQQCEEVCGGAGTRDTLGALPEGGGGEGAWGRAELGLVGDGGSGLGERNRWAQQVVGEGRVVAPLWEGGVPVETRRDQDKLHHQDLRGWGSQGGPGL